MQMNRRSSSWRAWFGAAALLGSTFVATGCAALGQNHTTSHAVQVVTQDSNRGHVSLVQTRVVDDRVAVNGYVENRFHAGGLVPGKLFVTAIGSDGKVMQEIETRYHRRFGKSKRSYFAETLAVNPEDVELIRVTHIGLGQ